MNGDGGSGGGGVGLEGRQEEDPTTQLPMICSGIGESAVAETVKWFVCLV